MSSSSHLSRHLPLAISPTRHFALIKGPPLLPLLLRTVPYRQDCCPLTSSLVKYGGGRMDMYGGKLVDYFYTLPLVAM